MGWKARNILKLLLIVLAVLSIFVGRTVMARTIKMPQLFDIFDTIIVFGSILVLAKESRILTKPDWMIGGILGILVAVDMYLTSIYTPYPFFGILNDRGWQALIRGCFSALATLGGLVVMRKSGPFLFRIARGDWRRSGKSLLFGLIVGLPLAGLNVYFLLITEGKSISWQNPLTAILDGLQPALMEEVIYRFAFLGLLWLVLQNFQPHKAVWISGIVAMLVHNYAHFSDLFVDAPFTAIGMGALMCLLWGLPLTILVIRKDLESAIGFHWIQDILRFMTGF